MTYQKIPNKILNRLCGAGYFFILKIGCIDKTVIGDNTLLASKILTDQFHGKINSEELKLPVINRPLFSKGPVIIGKNVWVGMVFLFCRRYNWG